MIILKSCSKFTPWQLLWKWPFCVRWRTLSPKKRTLFLISCSFILVFFVAPPPWPNVLFKRHLYQVEACVSACVGKVVQHNKKIANIIQTKARFLSIDCTHIAEPIRPLRHQMSDSRDVKWKTSTWKYQTIDGQIKSLSHSVKLRDGQQPNHSDSRANYTLCLVRGRSRGGFAASLEANWQSMR